MSSKKKHRKKQLRPKIQAKPQRPEIEAAPAEIAPVAPRTDSAPATAAVPHQELIRRDVRKVVVLSVVFIIAQLVLWYLFEQTPVGSAVYRLVQF